MPKTCNYVLLLLVKKSIITWLHYAPTILFNQHGSIYVHKRKKGRKDTNEGKQLHDGWSRMVWLYNITRVAIFNVCGCLHHV